MWPTNDFGNNGNFQNNFNQDDFVPSPFAALPGAQTQQYPPNHLSQPNMMQFDDSNGEGYMKNDFQPEIGLYNSGVFLPNQFTNPANAQFSSPHLDPRHTASPTLPRPVTNISTRAAELKAQLLRNKQERASSATPPVTMAGQVSKQSGTAEGSSSMRGSPQTPATTKISEQALNIHELISQFSKPTADSVMNQENKKDRIDASNPQRLSHPDPSAKSQTPSLGSPTKVPNRVNGPNAREIESRHASNGSISEGEIPEDSTATKASQLNESTETKDMAKPINKVEHATRQPWGEEKSKSPQRRGPRDDSPRRASLSNTRPKPSRHFDDRRDEPEARQDRKAHVSDYKNERRPYLPDSDSLPYHYRDMHDQNDGRRRPEIETQQKREETVRPNRETEHPTLAELLPHDEDLKEWLEITGYHNGSYRDKILNRRRAIAALDAQRNALLAEMEAEERGGVPVVGVLPTTPSTMLPPSAPNKDRVETPRKPKDAPQESPRDRVVSNKRPRDIQDPHEEGGAGKIARTVDRGPRIKEDDDSDYRRPRSSGYDTSRRRSIGDHRDERESSRPRYEEVRGRGRGDSRERDISPRRTRTRSYETSDDFHSRDTRDDFDGRGRQGRGDSRPFEVRGGYRGRAFDPNYRGRAGRGGRGRGDFQSHLEPKNESSSYGSRLANGKPFKDTRGFDRGGKGETRYFIVKSFNEENVVKCIEDGVWTTQVQNGPLFEEAFKTCKNVILVFSINKSRAFQGYARMESVPGSIEVPSWQRAINWESTGAFKVKWLVICSTRFHRIGHLRNAFNDNQAVLIGKDGQEIEENCGRGLIELINEEADQALSSNRRGSWEE